MQETVDPLAVQVDSTSSSPERISMMVEPLVSTVVPSCVASAEVNSTEP